MEDTQASVLPLAKPRPVGLTRRSISRSQEQRERRIDHSLDELVRKHKHLERDLDRDDGEEELEPAHEADRPLEALDFGLMLLDELLLREGNRDEAGQRMNERKQRG